MKDKLLNIAEWYDCFNERPEVIPFTPSKVCRNWRNGNVKQKAWIALAVFICCSVGLFSGLSISSPCRWHLSTSGRVISWVNKRKENGKINNP